MMQTMTSTGVRATIPSREKRARGAVVVKFEPEMFYGATQEQKVRYKGRVIYGVGGLGANFFFTGKGKCGGVLVLVVLFPENLQVRVECLQ